MKRTTRNAAIAALAALTLAAGAAYAGSDRDADRDSDRGSDRDSDNRPGDRPTITDPATLSIEEILARLREAGYADIDEIEHEHGRYEVEARNPAGERVELYVSARTGEVLEEERDD